MSQVTKKDLKQYKYLVREIKELEEELAAIYSDGITSRYGDAVRSSTGKKNDLADRVEHVINIEELLDGKLQQRKAERQRIEDALEERLDADERLIIRMIYMRCLSRTQIALRQNCSEPTIDRIHGRALQKLAQ